MFPPKEPWRPELNWDTQAGRALTKVLEYLPRDRAWQINVFGSAPLQMGLEPGFASADVDIFTRDDWRSVMLSAIDAAGLAKHETQFYVQCVPAGAFRTSQQWRDRAHSEERDGVQFRFAHPIDILIGKLNRLAPKDMSAFHLVIQKTGHPTEAELIEELQASPDLFSFAYMPALESGGGTSFWANTMRLWEMVFGRKIDVEREILKPAYARLKEAYEVPDLKADLAKLAADPPDSSRAE